MKDTQTLSQPASKSIRFALWRATKVDYRTANLTQAEAVKLLQAANEKSGYTGKAKTSAPIATTKIVKAKQSIPTLEQSARAYIVENIQPLVDSFLEEANIVGVVKNDTNFVPDDGKRFVMFGGGCGFAWLAGYRKTAKNKALVDLISGLKKEADTLVTTKLPIHVLQTLQQHGALYPLLAQSEHYNATWRNVQIGWLEAQGVKGCYVMSRLD